MDIKFNVSSFGTMPTRGTEHSAGLDLYTPSDITLDPGIPTYVDLGVRVEIPAGHVGLLTTRSSMGKHGVTLANSIGIIDADYRGPLGVTLINNAAWSQAYLKGDRIAQLVVLPFLLADPVPVEELTVTERGEGGFGSTGR